MFYESLLAFGVAFFFGLLFCAGASVPLTGLARKLFQLYEFIVLGAYFVWCWHRGGQTLPMTTWRLRLVSAADGRGITVARAALRYALAWPSIALLGAGLVWAFVDREHQFLHDRLAGTKIVASDR